LNLCCAIALIHDRATISLKGTLPHIRQFSRMLRFRPIPHAFSAPIRVGLAILSGIAFLSGCGFVKFEPREAWRGEAEAACMRAGVVKPSDWVRVSRPVEGSGPCGLDIPLKVSAFENDRSVLQSFAQAGLAQGTATGIDLRLTVVKPEATLTCPMVAWLDDWVAGAVQPAALAWFGRGIREIRSGGTYACRRRNHQPGARLSEHAFGNAMDIMAFILTDGTVVTVKGGWRGQPAEQGFLRDVLHAACSRFRTVLGPGSDAFHYDHFHFDLARHDASGQRRYCRPRLDAPLRPPSAPGGTPFSMPPMTAFGQQPSPNTGFTQDQQALRSEPPRATRPPGNLSTGEMQENEGEFDPKNFDVTSSASDLPRSRGLVVPQPLPPAQPGILPPAPKASRPAHHTGATRLMMPSSGH
jgi:hypothetical protein